MEDDYKKPEGRFDPYNFSEIKKIQQEIERDLNRIHGFSTPRSDKATDPAVEDVIEYESDFVDEIPPLYPMPSPTTALKTPEKFYTEVIKQEPTHQHLFPSKRLIISLLIICTLGTGTLGLGIGFGISNLQNATSIPAEIEGNNLIEDTVTAPTGGAPRQVFSTEVTTQEGSLADIVKLVDPAVVRIITDRPQSAANPFFGGNQMRTTDGSGIIFATDEERVFIVTSHHVTRGAEAVHVSVMEHDIVPARPVGNHQAADLAVISISLADLLSVGLSDVTVASFGDSNSIRVGDVVLAIGNAMGEGNATTSGIISAGEKEIIAMGRSFRVIQTDAAINPGSSGGPLINKQGQVIGINSSLITSEHYAVEGMGFSIPTNVAKPVIEEIMNATPRPFLGIHGLNISEEIAYQLDIPPIGVYIERVITGSSAYHAGIVRTDIITSFNGRAVFDMDQLIEEIRRRDIGDTVEITILRDGRQQITLQATLGADNNDNF